MNKQSKFADRQTNNKEVCKWVFSWQITKNFFQQVLKLIAYIWKSFDI